MTPATHLATSPLSTPLTVILTHPVYLEQGVLLDGSKMVGWLLPTCNTRRSPCFSAQMLALNLQLPEKPVVTPITILFNSAASHAAHGGCAHRSDDAR